MDTLPRCPSTLLSNSPSLFTLEWHQTHIPYFIPLCLHVAYSWAKKTQVQGRSPHSKCGYRHPSPAGWSFCWRKEALPPPVILWKKALSSKNDSYWGKERNIWSFQTSVFIGFACFLPALDTHWVFHHGLHCFWLETLWYLPSCKWFSCSPWPLRSSKQSSLYVST